VDSRWYDAFVRVVFYTHPHLFDAALPLARELSRLVELHLFLELTPGAWSAVFETAPASPARGIVPADPILGACVPARIRAYWCDAASFHLVSYGNRRTIHPSSLPVSHAACRFLAALRPDILHLDDVSLRLALDYPELPRIDVLSVHDPEIHSGERNWRRDLARWLTFRKVRRFVLHNHAQVERFRDRYGLSRDRVAVNHLGVYTTFQEWGDDAAREEPRTALFFGRTSQYKGLDLLYRAMPLVARQLTDVRLIVAGGPAYGYQPPAPPRLTNGGRIELIERYIPAAEVAALMRRAAVVICPYTDATQSGVVLTAYAFGKPIVATRVGGLPEYVRDGETGIVVEPGDAEALAAAIGRVLLDDGLRRTLRAGVERVAANELSWASRARDLVTLYSERAWPPRQP
jgi:glycosyltransferase involved in cell wall biosynthesis